MIWHGDAPDPAALTKLGENTLTGQLGVRFLEVGGVGMQINANHLRPVHKGLVRATATAEKLGRRSQVWTIRLVDGSGRLSCLCRATLAVIERAGVQASLDGRGADGS